MSNGNLLEELRDLSSKKELSTEQAMPLLMAAVADIYEDMKTRNEWEKKTEERLDSLESRDKKFVALVGAGAAVIGAVVGLIGHLIAAGL